jgi:hypothetical protein
MAVCENFERSQGVILMMVALLSVGIAFLLAGVLAIGLGIPVKEFSFGNTLIGTGALAACTGVVVIGLWMIVRELNAIARGLGSSRPAEAGFAPGAKGMNVERHSLVPENSDVFAHEGKPPLPENTGHAEAAPPWHEEAAARGRHEGSDAPAFVPEAAPAPPVVKQRRNLMFSSSSRKERERAKARMDDPSSAAGGMTPDVALPLRTDEPPTATFEDAWPQSERAKPAPAPRRGSRAPTTFTEANPGGADRNEPAARNEDQLPVTVLTSGVVDGMAYSLYSDGSIEAQMPEGLMRFASIDELRSHLDQRP